MASRALVLLYHRIAETSCDPQRLSVTPQHFAQHLEVLKRLGQRWTLRRLGEAMRAGKTFRRVVVVTFDDGYADNLYNAKPLLEKHDVPATFFLTTGYLGQNREYWWDDLERVLLQPGVLPETLRVCINGVSHAWQLGETSQYSEEAFALARGWNAVMQPEQTPRQRAYIALCALLRGMFPEDRERVLAELRVIAKVGATGRLSHRSLSVTEAAALAGSELTEIGAHTVNHPVLAALPIEQQRQEITGSKNRLEEILGHRITFFAYPFGMRADYTNDTVAAVRQSGFTYACANFYGQVQPQTDLYQLPRHIVRDWDGDTFACRLEEWFG